MTYYSDLCAQSVSLSDGVPLGYGNWRLVLRAAITNGGGGVLGHVPQ